MSQHCHPKLYPVTGKGRLRHLVRLQGGLCWWCLRPFGWSLSWHSRPTIEHVHPRSKGGENESFNLTASCYQCNQLKADFIVPDHWSAAYTAEVFTKQTFREALDLEV